MIRNRGVSSNFWSNSIMREFNWALSLILIFNSYKYQLEGHFLRENSFLTNCIFKKWYWDRVFKSLWTELNINNV